jgi:Tfp pilus assembly protein PilE
MISIIIISILSCLVVLLSYTTYNLLKKNEKAEDILISYKEYIDKLSSQIEESNQKIKEIDEKGVFDSDDEIGWFFKELKKIQSSLEKFKIN